MTTRHRPLMMGLGQAALVVGFGVGLARRWFPLGVPGEWEWLRLPPGAVVAPLPFLLASLAVVGFAGFAALGARALAAPAGRGREASWVAALAIGEVVHTVPMAARGREAGWVAALAVGAVLVQGVVQEGAPQGYGLARWVLALGNPGSSGYATVARHQMPGGLARFLRDYPAWVERQDSLHIGTHPPGLFVVARGLLDLCQAHPRLVAAVADYAPGSSGPALRAAREANLASRSEGAALILTGALTLLASALTVVPLYLLARSVGSALLAWASACTWVLLPSALLFQPTADTAFPLLSTTALALASWSGAPRTGRGLGLVLATSAGVVLAVGMEFTLAFLAVGLVVALVLIVPSDGANWWGRLGRVAAVGLGFALATAAWGWATGANPLTIWWTNQAHHAQFYRDYPRSRVAWAVANALESLVAIGLPVAVGAAVAGLRPRRVPVVAWAAVGVLVALTISGRSLSEVPRLWLPMYPPILVAAAMGWQRLGSGSVALGGMVLLQGVQTSILLVAIQVVYPV